MEASNGLDGLPGTMDDWIDNNENYPDTNLRPGPDGVFGTGDDEVYWNGPDGISGTEDDERCIRAWIGSWKPGMTG